MNLTVKPLTNREPGSGMAVIDRTVLQDTGLTSGDFVAIERRDGGRTVAREGPTAAGDIVLTAEHFERALDSVEPSGKRHGEIVDPASAGPT